MTGAIDDIAAREAGFQKVEVVDTGGKFLYLVEAGGMSTRYGIGVGRAGFSWSGEATIKDKQEWPKWFPPKEMQQRDMRAWFYADGMDGGSRNPLGARARGAETRAVLDYAPSTSIETGVGRFVDWYREYYGV